MEIKSFLPVNISFSRHCVEKNSDVFKNIGRFPFIVTGRSSAKLSGALSDVLKAIGQTPYILYDRVENNPDVSNVEDGAMMCKRYGCDSIIAIGGGSALDAAKAIAVLAVSNMTGMELFSKKAEKALPIIAIPTTSGTGSEVTPYSILTIKEWQTKKSFGAECTFAKYAFLDPAYTYSLPENITISTAFDAASHLFESYFSKKSTPVSMMYAMDGMKVFAGTVNYIDRREFSDKTREDLMYASMLGGMAITHTGTTAMHAMGYSMTYFMDMPHGFANLSVCRPYFAYIEKTDKTKMDTVVKALGFESVEALTGFFLRNMEVPVLTEEQCARFAHIAMIQSSVKATPGELTETDLYNMYREVRPL
jgi:alcohol dehydrogenase class IV